MQKNKPSWPALFRKIKGKDDALAVIKQCFYFFIAVGILQVLVGIFLLPSLLIDGFIYIILAMWLSFKSSRVAAILLLILSSLSVVTTLLNKFEIISLGGQNIYLAIAMVLIAVQGVRASFYLHKKR